MKPKVIFVPGYHGGGEDILSPQHQFWFPWLKDELEKLGVKVIAEDFPDPWDSRAQYWLPHMVHKMLNTELHEFHDRGHFGVDKPYTEFPELLIALKEKIEI